MLLQVYYGQDEGINTWPYLIGCVFIYFAYKWIKSVRDQPSRQEILEHENNKVAEREAKANALVEQSKLSSSSPSLDSIAAVDEAREEKADAIAAAIVRVAASSAATKAKLAAVLEEDEDEEEDELPPAKPKAIPKADNNKGTTPAGGVSSETSSSKDVFEAGDEVVL
jgi:hypothetical protein